MTEEEKWLLVNQAEDASELRAAIGTISENGEVRSNRQDRTFDANRLKFNVDQVIAGAPAIILTRSYGIRQQALYIKYHEQLEKNHVTNHSDLPGGDLYEPGIQTTPTDSDRRTD